MNDLYGIIYKENDDSEIVVMNIVVRDSNSGDLSVYSLGKYGLENYKIE